MRIELLHRMRKQELNHDVQVILTTRFELSKSGFFSLSAIAKGWEMSIATLHRYKSPTYRELSREITRKRNSIREGFDGKCFKCEESLKGHPKCVRCTILIHSYVEACRCGRQHGLADIQGFCTDCIDSLLPTTISPYEEALLDII